MRLDNGSPILPFAGGAGLGSFTSRPVFFFDPLPYFINTETDSNGLVGLLGCSAERPRMETSRALHVPSVVRVVQYCVCARTGATRRRYAFAVYQRCVGVVVMLSTAITSPV